MARSKKMVPVTGDASEYLKKAESAAKELGWTVKSATPTKLEITSGFNFFTVFGEKITIEPSGNQAKIVSKTKNPLLVTGWGQNVRNIKKLVNKIG